jgi:hypothetical protein
MPPQSEIDLRILAEMADEIREHGYCGLPGSLRALIKTKRGKDVGTLLEKLALELLHAKFAHENKIRALDREINGLRNEMQIMTDLAEGGDPFED